MNEWGIPDWRVATAYGDVAKWHKMRWRWEFYRRRDDLRVYFDANAEQTYQECLKYCNSPNAAYKGRVLKPDEAGFAAQGYLDEVLKFGYASIPNPRISEQTSDAIFPVFDWPGSISTYYGLKTKDVDGNAAPITLEDNQFAVIFDIDKPVAPQIESAKRALELRQDMKHGQKLQRRRHPDKWLTYLRVLDARKEGATWAEIAEILTQTARTEQSARDTWNQANDLCFNF